MSKTLVKFVKKNVNGRKKQRVGVVIAKQLCDEILYGWSLLNYKAGDKWDRDYAISLAEMRLCNANTLAKLALAGNIPQSIHRELLGMITRAEAYFQNPQYSAALHFEREPSSYQLTNNNSLNMILRKNPCD
jgi:hypothetical protein